MNCSNCNGHIDLDRGGFVICKNCGHVNIANPQEKHNIPLHVRAPNTYNKRTFESVNIPKKKRFTKKTSILAGSLVGVFLLLIVVGLGFSNFQAENYLSKAQVEVQSLNFEKADEYLNKSNRLFAFSSTKERIKELKSKNDVWLKDSRILAEAEELINQKKYAEAMEKLKQISKEYPDKEKISALFDNIQKVLDSHALNPDNLGIKKETTSSITQKTPATGTTPTQPVSTPCPSYSTVSRSSTDRPDEVSGYQVHFIYVLPSDRADRQMDINGQIANSVSSFQNWLCAQSGGKHIRMDTVGGALDVSFVRLKSTDNALKIGLELPWATNPNLNPYLLNDLDMRLKALGFNNPNKIYAIYYDGASNYACGAGSWPPAVPGKIGAIFMHGRNPSWPSGVKCESNLVGTSRVEPAYIDFSMLHEIIHTLGFVANCAPHANSAHTTDNNNDLMYTGDLPWQPSLLDPGNDDYYNTNRTDCIDLSNSAFMVGGGSSLPPGW